MAFALPARAAYPVRLPPTADVNRYNALMANHVYASFWAREHSEELMLDRFERLLEAVPLSSIRSGFQSLIIRAVNASETPLVEHDAWDNYGSC